MNTTREILENSIISHLLVWPNDLKKLRIKEFHFQDTKNRQLFAWMLKKHAERHPIDFVVACCENQGLLNHINAITNEPFADDCMPLIYQQHLIDFWYADLAKNVMAEMQDQDPLEIAAKLAELAAQKEEEKKMMHVSEIIPHVFAIWEKASESGGRLTGISSGMRQLDDLTGGFARGCLYIVAARPSMGKSAFALNLALNACLGGHSVYLQALEDSKESIVARMWSNVASVSHEGLSRGQEPPTCWDKLIQAQKKVESFHFEIDDTGGLTSNEIYQRAMKSNADMIIVDHLQQIYDEAQSRHLAISQACARMKMLAKAKNVPVILLCQLSRAVEQRPEKRPQLSDLKESGDIEAIADVVMMLYREKYYNRESSSNDMDCSVAKNRNGRTGFATLSWDPRFMRVTDSPFDQNH